MKKILLTFVTLITILSNTFAIELGDIVRRENGKVLEIDHNDATVYCKKIGSRLPTDRELALYSQRLGSKGILETAYPDISITKRKVQAEIGKVMELGYYRLEKNIFFDVTINYYFSHEGYRTPDGDLGKYNFWSSTIRDLSFNDNSEAYFFSGDDGVIYYISRDMPRAVRCISKN